MFCNVPKAAHCAFFQSGENERRLPRVSRACLTIRPCFIPHNQYLLTYLFTYLLICTYLLITCFLTCRTYLSYPQSNGCMPRANTTRNRATTVCASKPFWIDMGLCSSRQNAEGSYDPSPFTLFLGTSSKVTGTRTCPCEPPHPDPCTRVLASRLTRTRTRPNPDPDPGAPAARPST